MAVSIGKNIDSCRRFELHLFFLLTSANFRHIGAEEEFLAVNLELHGPSLEECLEHYVNGELLECDNAYYCCKCEEKVRVVSCQLQLVANVAKLA